MRRGLGPRRAGRVAATVAVSVLAVLAADSLAGLAYHRSTAASVLVTPSAGSGTVAEALVVFPGYAADGAAISTAFAPYLAASRRGLGFLFAVLALRLEGITGITSSPPRAATDAPAGEPLRPCGAMPAGGCLLRWARALAPHPVLIAGRTQVTRVDGIQD